MAGVDRSLVAGVPVFAGLAPEQIDQLLQEAQSVRYAKGTTVFQQDEEAHSFFILLHGHLRVFKLTPDGQQVVVRFVAPGEVFGVAMAIGVAACIAVISIVGSATTPQAKRGPLLPDGSVARSSLPSWTTIEVPSSSKTEVGPASKVKSLVVNTTSAKPSAEAMRLPKSPR